MRTYVRCNIITITIIVVVVIFIIIITIITIIIIAVGCCCHDDISMIMIIMNMIIKIIFLIIMIMIIIIIFIVVKYYHLVVRLRDVPSWQAQATRPLSHVIEEAIHAGNGSAGPPDIVAFVMEVWVSFPQSTVVNSNFPFSVRIGTRQYFQSALHMMRLI